MDHLGLSETSCKVVARQAGAVAVIDRRIGHITDFQWHDRPAGAWPVVGTYGDVLISVLV